MGYAKLWFCANQVKKDGLDYCWVDTYCINKANHSELDKAIRSMFHWYQGVAKCYVYLTDVTVSGGGQQVTRTMWEATFRASRWFRRGWTLQELLAPASVEFFLLEGHLLGNKQTLEGLIHDVTTIPVAALRGIPLSAFTVDKRRRWTAGRETKKVEDWVYCLLGIFGIFIPLMYGEGEHVEIRLGEEIKKGTGKYNYSTTEWSLTLLDATQCTMHIHWTVARTPNPLFMGREDVLHGLGAIISNAVTNPAHQDQCRIVVLGMGGQGKSEICLQLAHRFRPK